VSRRWVDVTRPLGPDSEVYPGDPEVRFELREGDGFFITAIRMGSHSGTHLDAPRHLDRQGVSVDEIAPEILCGTARLVVPGADPLGPDELHRHGLSGEHRVLFRTRTPAGPGSLTPDGAAWIRDRGIRLIGWDRLSIDPVEDPALPAHRILLEAGVIVAEGLDLLDLPPGRYDLIALPLRLVGLDGSPARILVRSLG
jgi:arylformamidase